MNEREERVALAVKRKRMKRLTVWGGALVVLGAIIFLTVFIMGQREENLPGISYSEAGKEHIAPGALGSGHNSNPPTSGEHYAQPAEWGVYDEELPDETLIHNLEHGGIWISYRPDAPEDVIMKLEGFYGKWGRKIIVTPRSANDADIALAAWTRLDKFSIAEYSDERVDGFIKAYRNKGPEFVP